MFSECSQSRFACYNRVFPEQTDEIISDQAREKDGPKQCHAVVGTRFCDGRNAARSNVETDKEQARKNGLDEGFHALIDLFQRFLNVIGGHLTCLVHTNVDGGLTFHKLVLQ